MTDLDVFLLLFHASKVYFLSKESQKRILQEEFQVPISNQTLEEILSYPPTPKQLVQGLAGKGLTQQAICQHTNLSQSTVSYHLNTVNPKPYTNPAWRRFLEEHGK